MKPRGVNGFTLLELMVTLAIVALVVAIALPYLSHPNVRSELQNGAKEISAALRLTRSRAIIEDREATFVVDVANGRFQPAGAKAPRALARGVHVALFTATDQEVSDTVGTIRFYPDGSSSGGGVALIDNGQRFDVLVDWLTGGVSIYERAAAAAQ